MTPMSRRRLFIFAALAALVALPQRALAASGGVLPLAELSEVPRWPIYIAIVVAALIFSIRTVLHFRERANKAKIFPKLALRRRLYAPYSGGNCAQVSFGSSQDA